MEVTSSGNEQNVRMFDDKTKTTLSTIPTLTERCGPQDGDEGWVKRLKEEYTALIKYVKSNKEAGTEWFKLSSNKDGTKWNGKCWYMLDLRKYEFDLSFEIPVTYPASPPDIKLPELDGKTAKMYRGGRICTDDHFVPLWTKNVPKYGIAHALAIGLAPWLAVEIPSLALANKITAKSGNN